MLTMRGGLDYKELGNEDLQLGFFLSLAVMVYTKSLTTNLSHDEAKKYF